MKTNNSIENPLWALIGRYLTGEATPAETKKVEAWAAVSQKNRDELEQARRLLDGADAFYAASRYDTDKAWASVRKHTVASAPVQTRQVSHKKAVVWYSKYAAAVIIALLLGAATYLYVTYSPGNPKYTEIVTGNNQVIEEYILPDGTFVTLNSNSTLHFPEKFEGNIREVFITGEAFFDVTPDAAKPFIIHAGNAQVKVLGTSFNVHAYPDAETVEVTVESGTVQLLCCESENTGLDDNILLNAGERGTLLTATNKLEKTVNADLNYLAWKTRNLEFVKTPLSEVVKTLENMFGVRIDLLDPKLENLLLTAQFEKKNAEFILDVICLTFDLELTRQNEIYMLSEKTMSNN